MKWAELVEKVQELPGITIFPGWLEVGGGLVEQSEKLAAATGTTLEWNIRGSPRFMPSDHAEAEKIRDRWRNAGLNVESHPAPSAK